MAGGICQIFVRLVAIVFGFTADAFYTGFMRRPRPDQKPMPKWFGKDDFYCSWCWVHILGIVGLAADTTWGNCEGHFLDFGGACGGHL